MPRSVVHGGGCSWPTNGSARPKQPELLGLRTGVRHERLQQAFGERARLDRPSPRRHVARRLCGDRSWPPSVNGSSFTADQRGNARRADGQCGCQSRASGRAAS